MGKRVLMMGITRGGIMGGGDVAEIWPLNSGPIVLWELVPAWQGQPMNSSERLR